MFCPNAIAGNKAITSTSTFFMRVVLGVYLISLIHCSQNALTVSVTSLPARNAIFQLFDFFGIPCSQNISCRSFCQFCIEINIGNNIQYLLQPFFTSSI